MNRHPFIRFFISSTFVDMAVERNALQNVFNRLSNEYRSIGWQIEVIDLRWGINTEASKDNRTMRICLNELKICQQMSPKPNFIILLGERYGWIPLPEVISDVDMAEIMELANPVEYELLNKWYILDRNALPEDEYIIQRRDLDGITPDEYLETVEKPLRILFNRYAASLADDKKKVMYKCSATEQEIYQGALSVLDADKHVFAYFRTLKNVPQNQCDKFFPDRTSMTNDEYVALSSLKQVLKEKLSDENIFLQDDIEYADYISGAYSSFFEKRVEEYLHRIIQQEIATVSKDTIEYEINEHKDFAKIEAMKFWGCEEDLSFLRTYIECNNEDKPLWIKAASGMGKTALMTKIVDEYENKPDTVVICRFCGLTANTCDGRNMLLGLWNELFLHLYKKPFTFTPNIQRILFGSEECEKNISLFDTDYLVKPYNYFAQIWHSIRQDRRVLIIIDSLNQLDISYLPWLPKMEWLPSKLLPGNVKIILTSTNDALDYSFKTNRVNYYFSGQKTFEGFTAKSSGFINKDCEFIEHCLNLTNRKLTKKQWDSLSSSICLFYEKTPIYLSLLAAELSHYKSTDVIGELPTNFHSMVFYIINELSLPQNHGEELVKLALALIATNRLGVSDEEMNQLLALDKHYYQSVQQFSFHKWGDESFSVKSVPPIFWSRLSADLSFFLRTRNTKAGLLKSFSHDLFMKVVTEEVLTPELRQRANNLWINYFSDKWNKGDKHAIHELAYVMLNQGLMDKEDDSFVRFLNLLIDIDYILLKRKIFGDEIAEEFDWAINWGKNKMSVNDLEYIIKLRNEIMNMPICSETEMIYRALNLADNSPLRNSVLRKYDGKDVLENILRNLSLDDTIIYHTDKFGSMPLINENGEKVISLYRFESEVVLQNMKEGTRDLLFTIEAPAIKHDIDKDFLIYAILTKRECCVWNLETKKLLYKSELRENLEWLSLSKNGKKVIFGGEKEPAVIVDLSSGMSWNFNGPLASAKLSPDAIYLWVTYPNGVFRYNTTDWSSFTICYDIFFGGDDKFGIKEKAGDIVTCTNNIVCIGNSSFNYLIIEVDGKTVHCIRHYAGESFIYGQISDEEREVCLFSMRGASVQIQWWNLEDNNGSEVKSMIYKTYPVDAINSCGTIAVCREKALVFDYQKQKERMVQTGVGNSGVNSLSSDLKGDVLMASMGKRHTEINERTILEIHYSEEGYKERIIRPQVKSTTQYICASAIAPNGTSFAYSLHGGLAAGTIAIVGLGDDRRKFSQELSACTAMQFTHDSRYLIAAKGDYIADGPIFIYIISAEGKLIGNYYNSENYDNGIAHNICVTPDNRFLVFGDKFECQILDMISMKTIGLKDVRVNVLRYYSLDLFPYWAIHPNGSRIYVSSENELHIIHLPEGQHTSMLNDKFVLCFSPDGKFLFEKDVLGNLYRRSLITGEEVEIQKSIYHVIPSLEGRYLYIVCKTMEILFCDYNGRILQKAYSNDCIRFKLTARGLAIAQDDGRILLFAPDEKYKANIPAIAWSVRSWNLEIKEQEEKKIICPLCGHVIKKDVIGDLSCENCAALIHVVL